MLAELLDDCKEYILSFLKTNAYCLSDMYYENKKECLPYENINILFDRVIINNIPNSHRYNSLKILIKNNIAFIPNNLRCVKLIVSGNNIISYIPNIYNCKHLEIYGKNTISTIPEGLECKILIIYGHNTISRIPKSICLSCNRLEIDGYNTISEIPSGCRIKRIEMYGKNTISYIPDDIRSDIIEIWVIIKFHIYQKTLRSDYYLLPDIT